MSKEPVLVIMAAGMGSRYGGLKQMDAVGSGGELIIDFSLYDAMTAGFKKVIFIIKREIEEDFRALIDNKAGKFLETEYAFQELSDIPDGYFVPEGREKPWGTGHAVLAARNFVDSPFAVINADDFYGAGAFKKMYDFLTKAKDDEKMNCCMVGYRLENTLTDSGHVTRGVCETDRGFLEKIVETMKIERRDEKIMYEKNDETWAEISGETVVSMNFWGFSEGVMNEISEMFPSSLEKIMRENTLKGEFLLPLAVEDLLRADKAKVKILMSEDKWHGVTYKEDRDGVVSALQEMKDKGLYPEVLWK